MRLHLSMLVLLLASALAGAEDRVAKFPGVEVDLQAREVRVACEALRVEVPLEFVCVLAGTSEHESLLRTKAEPKHIHTGLLMLGLEPGTPLRWSDAANQWLPPHGPPLELQVSWKDADGKEQRVPIGKLIRDDESKKPMPAQPFVFVGSKTLDDGRYAADLTGYVVSLVNFDLSLIDVPELASNANETLGWETNLDAMPPAETPMTLIIRPIGQDGAAGDPKAANADAPVEDATDDLLAGLPHTRADQQKLDTLRQRWEAAVTPNADALRSAAQTHYEVIRALRDEQQRLIDEADKVNRLIDDLDRRYREATTPRPAPVSGDASPEQGE